MADAGFMPLRIEEVAAPDVLTDALRFRRSMEIDTVGILLFVPNGPILRANDAFLAMSGYSREDMRSGKVLWAELIPPEWQTEYAKALRQLQATGSISPLEKQYLRKDGSRFWVMVASKLLNETEGISFILDITERKEAEARLLTTQMQLERSDSQLQTITDAAPALIAYVDPRLRYIRVNRAYAQFFGATPEDLIGRSMSTTLGTVFHDIEQSLQLALKGEPQQLETVFSGASNRARHMVSQYVPDVTPEGHVLGIVIHASDMTDRRETEQILRTAEKLAAVGRLAASMAHEINNPLEAVTNLLFLARQSTDGEATQAFLQQAEAELRRVAAITSQTLRFHKQSTRASAVQAEELFASVLAVYTARLQNGSVEVRQRLRMHKPVMCFEGEIRQVLSNLVSNALDAMAGRDAVLSLRASPATEWRTGRCGIRFVVADNGNGMSPVVQRRAGEAFFTTKEVGGTGLGLWVSRDIAERHAGGLRVRSAEGRGSLFALWLPLEAVER